jgi:hypothetical protein
MLGSGRNLTHIRKISDTHHFVRNLVGELAGGRGGGRAAVGWWRKGRLPPLHEVLRQIRHVARHIQPRAAPRRSARGSLGRGVAHLVGFGRIVASEKGTGYVSESGMKRTSGHAKRHCDRAHRKEELEVRPRRACDNSRSVRRRNGRTLIFH